MSETRDKIVAAAARLFYEQGYAATGIATICREAGVKPGSLYHFFRSKDELLIGVLGWYEANLRPIVMDPVEARTSDPLERIFTLLAWYRSNMEATGCRMGCPIGNLALELSDTHPEIRPHIDINFANWSSAVEQWLVEAGDRLPPDVDRGALARLVLTIMEGALMQVRSSNSLQALDEGIGQLRGYIGALAARAERAEGARELGS